MTLCYVALGSNLDNPMGQVTRALAAIEQLPGTRVLSVSSWYESDPVGPGDQPTYINGVAGLEYADSAHLLLEQLQTIEAAQGRQRGQRWAARTLDLDILLFGNQHFEDEQLSVPHPRMNQRNFVLQPLAELAPDLTLPCGTPIASLLAHCPQGGLRKLDGTNR